MGKSRVAPLKSITVPRLELTAALLSVKVSILLGPELEYDNVSEFFWTDSQVVLGYIQNDSKRFKVFVANRVQQIRDHTRPNQWKFISTIENPADIASRGLTPDEFLENPSWLNGPKFLWENNSFQVNEIISPDLNQNDPELKIVKVLATQNTGFCYFEPERLEHIFSWYRAKRAIAKCLRLLLVPLLIQRASVKVQLPF